MTKSRSRGDWFQKQGYLLLKAKEWPPLLKCCGIKKNYSKKSILKQKNYSQPTNQIEI